MADLTPETREEMYLDEIANALENGGGGVGFTPLASHTTFMIITM